MWWQHNDGAAGWPRREGEPRSGKRVESDQALVKECEAYLSGRLTLATRDQWQRAPAWIWLSVLAHGSAERIAALANDDPLPEVTVLARQILTTTRCERALVELQQAVLIPLELEILDNSSMFVDPSEFVPRALDGLRRFRGSSQR